MNSSKFPTCSSTQLWCRDATVSPYRRFCIEAVDFNCSWYRDCDCPTLRADPDIAGKGVIWAFIVTAGLTLIGTVAFLLFRPQSEFTTLNPINKRLRLVVSQRLQTAIGPKMSKVWAEALFEIVMQLSDQQLVTGTALLVTIIYLRNQGAITVYHYTMATNLAWFSSNTHLLSLLVLRGWLSEERKVAKRDESCGTRPRSLSKSILNEFRSVWRAAFMVIMAVLLIYTNRFSAYEDWSDNFNCPVNCVPSTPIGGEPKRWLVINLVFILSGYPVALIGLFSITRSKWMSSRKGIQRTDKKIKTRIRSLIIRKLYKRIRDIFLYLWHFLASEIFGVLFQIAWFGLGIRWVVEDRKRGHNMMSYNETGIENTLGFGQLVPILLLALPVMSFLEACYYSWTGLDSEAEQKHLFETRMIAQSPLESSDRLWHDFDNNPQEYLSGYSDSLPLAAQPAQNIPASTHQ